MLIKRYSLPSRFRSGAVAAALGVVAVTGLTAVPAHAAAATYNNACGSGYKVLGTLDLTGGHAYLTYSSTSGYNCVVTVRNTSGTAVEMGAWVRRYSDWEVASDFGSYTTYAGPVYLSAVDQCIDWGGNIGASDAWEQEKYCG